nr:putative small nuclear ribonucleoprotein G [Cryptomonas sp.]
MHFPKNSLKIDVLINKKISVTLHNNDKLEGTLIGFDQFFNLVISNCVVIFGEKIEKNVKTILVRGNMVSSIEQIKAN